MDRRSPWRLTVAAALALTTVVLATTGAGASTHPARQSAAADPDPAAEARAKAAAIVAGRPGFLRAGPDDAFVQRPVISSGDMRYVPYERTYRGVPVVGGDFVLVIDRAGALNFASVAAEKPITGLSVVPTLTASAAEKVAAGRLRSHSRTEGTRLVVYALGGAPLLAYESIVDGTGPDGISRLTVYVDARTGAVVDTRENVRPGTGTGAFNGPNPLGVTTTRILVGFAMADPDIDRLACQDLGSHDTLIGIDDVWGNGVGTNFETACVDGLFAAQTQVRMLAAWFGRHGMDGAGGAWPVRIGLDDQNAFYDGTQVAIGHNPNGAWVSSLDIVGHEMGHGVDDHTPGGISRGGTQEFVADAFGAMTEWFAGEPAQFDPPDFTVGEEVNLTGSGPIRSMHNPSLNGDPNCFSTSIPNQEVHTAAGPGNHWFYLLSMGSNPANGQPVSPTCDGRNVTGVGIETAAKILYNAMLMKTSASSYPAYRTWTLIAAKNLTPGNCAAFRATRAAWDAVAVPAQLDEPACQDLHLLKPGRADTVVGVPVSITLFASGGVPPYSWSATGLPTGLSINPSTGLISGTPTVVGTSQTTVSVTDHSNPPETDAAAFPWNVTAEDVQEFNGSGSGPNQAIARSRAIADAQFFAAAEGYGHCTLVKPPEFTPADGGGFEAFVTMACKRL